MDNISIKPISSHDILTIIPLLKILNKETPDKLLKERVLEMASQNYECIGLYDHNELIGICGIWYCTKHYIGKTAEVDHVMINNKYRNKGLGKIYFNWIYDYLTEKGCEATELNTYVNNKKSHKFYYNEGYEIYGFHMLKILRENKTFY